MLATGVQANFARGRSWNRIWFYDASLLT